MIIREIQSSIAKWADDNELVKSPELMTLGVMEELGEFSHALLKHRQKIRGLEDHEVFCKAGQDALGDCFIYLTQLSETLGWDLESIIIYVWQTVLQRNWRDNPEDADKRVGKI